MKILLHPSQKNLGRAVVAKSRGRLEGLRTKWTQFEDGERFVRVLESVRGQRVAFLSATHPPAENMIDTLIGLDALRRAGARVTLVLPHLGYSRQDHLENPGEPLSTELFLQLLRQVGANKLLTFDVHAPASLRIFGPRFKDLTALNLFARDIVQRFGRAKKNLVIVGPDHGAIDRARRLARLVGLSNDQAGWVAKSRPRPDVVARGKLHGDVRDKIVILIDDLIDTGRTLVSAAQVIRAGGAKKVAIYATHGLLTGRAVARLLAQRVSITTTDSLPAKSKYIRRLSLAPTLAQAILA